MHGPGLHAAAPPLHVAARHGPYRRALSREAAIAEVATEAGHQFCPEAARELLAVLDARVDEPAAA